jgi:hypothetical protein
VADAQTQNEGLPETVSRVAHQEMTDKRNTLQERVTELETTIKDFGYTEKARKHFSEKGLDDPDWAAEIALPSMKSAEVEVTDIGTYLDDKFAKLYPAAQPASVPGDDGVPTPDATEPPGFARPSPSAEGVPPGQKKYTSSDPEIKALYEANDMPKIRALIDSGELVLRGSPPVTPG